MFGLSARNSKLRRPLSTSLLTCGIAGLLGLSMLLSVGCSLVATEMSTNSGHRVLIPWSSDGQYKFEAISLNTLVSVSNLTGSAAMFMLSPSVVDSKLAGFQPRVRTFQDEQGLHIPTDSLSLNLLTLYAHIEKLQELDQAVGLGNLLPKPRIVGVEVRIPQRQRGRIENNALYSPQLDALLFVPYKGDNLPLAVNAGVVAHEHFHSLFNYMVLIPARAKIKTIKAAYVHETEESDLREIFQDIPAGARVNRDSVTGAEAVKKSQVVDEPSNGPVGTGSETVSLADWEAYHVNLLRAMNEGLADVWGWIYSGDNIFVRRSIPFVERSRDLEISRPQKLMTMEDFRDATASARLTGSESAQAYRLGTTYARTLKNVFEPGLAKAGRSRTELAKVIVKVMPLLKDRIENLQEGEWLKPVVLMELLVSQLSAIDNDLCEPLLRTDPTVSLKTVQETCQKRLETP